MVVELDVVAEALPGLFWCAVFVQVHLLVFDSTPQSLGKYVVCIPASPVHADLYPRLSEQGHILGRSELRPLVRVPDGRRSCLQGRTGSFHDEALHGQSHTFETVSLVNDWFMGLSPVMTWVQASILAAFAAVTLTAIVV